MLLGLLSIIFLPFGLVRDTKGHGNTRKGEFAWRLMLVGACVRLGRKRCSVVCDARNCRFSAGTLQKTSRKRVLVFEFSYTQY